MLTPSCLQTAQIIKAIAEIISVRDINSENELRFDDLDDSEKDTLCALALEALDYDIDLYASEKAKKYLAKSLMSYDSTDEYCVVRELKESLYEEFAEVFDELIEEQLSDIECERNYECNLVPRIDNTNGETIWERV